ncbi:hypothetical protein [Bradyrhizobium sp. WD16]|uniref:hypothetical protein n=1 Tax=Bradyrhizobium sp. WD16 TaxID=1521768 RepID=UPI0020A24395|nr:hypothetical protein [Bradyrhizobium sp. WD16]UTD26513.1 hypothetical protein DB459_05835 [Bradyrhizobium sp. WD16]
MTPILPHASLRLLLAAVIAAAGLVADLAQAQQVIAKGGVLSGELQAMRARGPDGKRVDSFQLVSEPRKLPGPDGLCNLETGPETFQLVTSSEAEAKQLKSYIGKQVSIRADQVSCAELAGQMSDAIVIKWALVTAH